MSSNRDGYYVHLPTSGGILDQPGVTMEILDVIREEYELYLRESNPYGLLE